MLSVTQWRQYLHSVSASSTVPQLQLFSPHQQPPGDDWRAHFQRCRELLELLQMLAASEQLPWRDMADQCTEASEDTPPFHIVIKHDDSNIVRSDITKFAVFFDSLFASSMRAEFRNVVTKIRTELTPDEKPL